VKSNGSQQINKMMRFLHCGRNDVSQI